MRDRIGVGLRLGACFIDVLVSMLLAMMVGQKIFPSFDAWSGVAVAGAFYSLIEGFTGASPGKRLVGLKIGGADGKTAGRRPLLIRYAVKNVAGILGVASLLTGIALFFEIGKLGGFLVFAGCFLALERSRQALHDLVAQTAVYKTERLEAGTA